MIDRNSFEPLYLQIRRDIEEQILNGVIKIGDKLMSETEMLRYYNVGRVTVRAALSELVSSGCLKKEQGLGTFCVALPKREERKKVDVMLDMRDTYFVPYILTGISRVLDARNCNLVLHDTQDSMEDIANTILKIADHGTDGIILQPFRGTDVVSDECRAAVERCKEMQIPLVVLDGKFRGIDDLPCVMNDDNLGGYMAACHAIEMGHKNILGLFRDYYKDSGFRKAGYLQAMREAGWTPCVVDAASVTAEDVMKLIKEEQITAVVCYNDALAVEYYHNLDGFGLKVAEDISVIGYDNTELSITSLPRITTITHPKDRMGAKAAEYLLELMSGHPLKQQRYMFRPELVVRNSVKRLK